MINPALNIARSIAEVEAAAAGFDAILPGHFYKILVARTCLVW
ncbi:MAG: hypothetical protein WEB60_09070 [Terrimicrobiaceae bacterium]